jgi:predicted metal-dependent hydrolase
MQFELNFRREHSALRPSINDWMRVGARRVRLRLVRNRHARRYVLRLCADGSARVTVPRGGSASEAKQFAQRNELWLERQLLRQALRPATPRPWSVGTEILFRGQTVRLDSGSDGERRFVRLGPEIIEVKDLAADLRAEVENYLWRLAAEELPGRVHGLAGLHQIHITRVSVRNQRSRWGSCSRRGTISLNWRLVQAPPFVTDYIILHELAHVKEMNHSSRFWAEVARLCPGFKTAEQWLKQNRLLNCWRSL